MYQLDFPHVVSEHYLVNAKVYAKEGEQEGEHGDNERQRWLSGAKLSDVNKE